MYQFHLLLSNEEAERKHRILGVFLSRYYFRLKKVAKFQLILNVTYFLLRIQNIIASKFLPFLLKV